MDSLNPYNPFENKKKNANYNEEQLSFIKELVELGWSANKIARTYGLTAESIRKRIRDDNWTTSKNGFLQQGLTNEKLEEIHQKVLAGVEVDELSTQYNISKEALLRRISNSNWTRAKRKNRYSFDEHYFDVIDNEHKAYWIGFLLADGYVLSKRTDEKRINQAQSFGFAVNSDDHELLENFKKDLKADNPIHYYKNTGSYAKSKTSYGRILLTSQHTIDTIREYGIRENKTFFVTFPDIPTALIPAMIRGYSDGDGSIIITKNNKYEWALCGTKEFLTGVQNFFGTSIQLSQRWPERNNNNYTLSYYGNKQVPKLLDIIYKDASIYLQRKYDKYAEMRGING
jgi:hypothetical protein